MAAVFANEGKAENLESSRAAISALKIRLFKTDVAPSSASTLASFTACNFGGYADQTLPFTTAAYLNAGNKGQMDSDVIEWTSTGGASNDVYGFVVYHATSNKVRFAYSLGGGASKPVHAAGDKVQVTLHYTRDQG